MMIGDREVHIYEFLAEAQGQNFIARAVQGRSFDLEDEDLCGHLAHQVPRLRNKQSVFRHIRPPCTKSLVGLRNLEDFSDGVVMVIPVSKFYGEAGRNFKTLPLPILFLLQKKDVGNA